MWTLEPGIGVSGSSGSLGVSPALGIGVGVSVGVGEADVGEASSEERVAQVRKPEELKVIHISGRD